MIKIKRKKKSKKEIVNWKKWIQEDHYLINKTKIKKKNKKEIANLKLLIQEYQ